MFRPGVRRSPEILPEIVISSFSKLRLTSIVAHFPASQVPDGLRGWLASTMHLVDAATRMQLVSAGQVAACVPFCSRTNKKKQKMTLYKAEDAPRRRLEAHPRTHQCAPTRSPVGQRRPLLSPCSWKVSYVQCSRHSLGPHDRDGYDNMLKRGWSAPRSNGRGTRSLIDTPSTPLALQYLLNDSHTDV